MRKVHIKVLFRHDNGLVIHIFKACRINPGFKDLIGQGKGFFIRLEYTDHIETVWRQGTQLDRNFRNDAERSLGTSKKLFQSKASRAFLQPCPNINDISCRRHHFEGIDLVARRPVLDSLVAACIVCNIAADLAGRCRRGISCIEQAMFFSFFLQLGAIDARLYDRVHGICIQFQDLVHPFQFYNHAMVDRNGATGHAGTCSPRRNGDKVLVGKFDNGCNFLCRTRENDDFWLFEKMRIAFLVGLVLIQSIFVVTNIFLPHHFFKIFEQFRRHRMKTTYHAKNLLPYKIDSILYTEYKV